jgi:hypothetical protein
VIYITKVVHTEKGAIKVHKLRCFRIPNANFFVPDSQKTRDKATWLLVYMNYNRTNFFLIIFKSSVDIHGENGENVVHIFSQIIYR